MSKGTTGRQAFAAFETLYPRLLAVVRERIRLEIGAAEIQDPGLKELLEDCAGRFGGALQAVYALGLAGGLVQETAWLVSVLDGRGPGRGWADRILEAWANAIQGLIKPPEGDDLARPLVGLRSRLGRLELPAPAQDDGPSENVTSYLEAALAGRRREAAEFALSLIGEGRSPGQVASGLLLPALRRIGRLWEKGRLNASSEHRATEITRYVIYRLFDSLPARPALSLKALLACVPGDEHALGIEITAGLLAGDGWSTVHVGRGAPRRDLVEAAADVRPDLIVLSASLIGHLPAARDLILDLGEKFSGVPIILGGAAAAAAADVLGPLVSAIASAPEEAARLARRFADRHA